MDPGDAVVIGILSPRRLVLSLGVAAVADTNWGYGLDLHEVEAWLTRDR